MKRITYLIAMTVTALSLVGGGAMAATQLAAPAVTGPISTPVGVQPDGRIAGCVKSTAGNGPAVLSVRRTNGTCGTGFKTVYWQQKGATGAKGAQGAKGDTGAAAPAAVYGVGVVNIKRGAGSENTWARATTAIGPVGGTASNTFRMTCSTANAPCVIKAQAYATTAGVTVYPRLLIQKSSIDTGAPVGLCEYADGSDNDGASQAAEDSEPTVGAHYLHFGIGGSLDCGSAQVRPASGVVDEIQVPAGYYDVAATFAFTK